MHYSCSIICMPFDSHSFYSNAGHVGVILSAVFVPSFIIFTCIIVIRVLVLPRYRKSSKCPKNACFQTVFCKPLCPPLKLPCLKKKWYITPKWCYVLYQCLCLLIYKLIGLQMNVWKCPCGHCIYWALYKLSKMPNKGLF